jgi:hypothetical protein
MEAKIMDTTRQENAATTTGAGYAEVPHLKGKTNAEDLREDTGAPLVAINAWLSHQGITPDEPDDTHVEAFNEDYQGEHDSVEDYAWQLFVDTTSDTVDVDSKWPYTCIDWERAQSWSPDESSADSWTRSRS